MLPIMYLHKWTRLGQILGILTLQKLFETFYQALVEVVTLTLDIGFSVIRISATTSGEEQS